MSKYNNVEHLKRSVFVAATVASEYGQAYLPTFERLKRKLVAVQRLQRRRMFHAQRSLA